VARNQPPKPDQHPLDTSGRAATNTNAVAVISAYGAFRVLLVLLAVWTFFEGFALFTGGVGALSFGGADRTAERVIGAQMVVFVPVYGLLAWQRERYRLLIWVPYFAQIAIVVPTAWALLRGKTDGVLLLVVSGTFFVLLFYFWWHSHPLDFFEEDDEPGDDDDLEDEDDDDDAEEGAPAGAARRPRPPMRGRDVVRRPGRFRRRDG
jgi:hypothetical protein